MTEADKAAWALVDRVWALYLSYQEFDYRLSAPPNLYLGQEEYRCLRLADDYLLRSRWGSPHIHQSEFMGMPVFIVNSKNHLNIGGIGG